MKASQHASNITEYFDFERFTQSIDEDETLRTEINKTVGHNSYETVAPLLRRLYNNAQSNSKNATKQGHRHDEVVKKFAASLLCLIGSGGCEMLQCNFGNALPHISTAHRVISKERKICEGEFYLNELFQNLKNCLHLGLTVS